MMRLSKAEFPSKVVPDVDSLASSYLRFLLSSDAKVADVTCFLGAMPYSPRS